MAKRRGHRAAARIGLAGLLLAGLGFLALGSVPARAEPPGKSEGPLRVVVHINFEEAGRQSGGLKNIENMLKAGAEAGIATEIEVVCHADGIVLLQKEKTKHPGQVEALQKKGVRFAACENTMRQRSIRREDLLPGTTTVPSGAFEVVRRQQQGYSYFKP